MSGYWNYLDERVYKVVSMEHDNAVFTSNCTPPIRRSWSWFVTGFTGVLLSKSGIFDATGRICIRTTSGATNESYSRNETAPDSPKILMKRRPAAIETSFLFQSNITNEGISDGGQVREWFWYEAKVGVMVKTKRRSRRAVQFPAILNRTASILRTSAVRFLTGDELQLDARLNMDGNTALYHQTVNSREVRGLSMRGFKNDFEPSKGVPRCYGR